MIVVRRSLPTIIAAASLALTLAIPVGAQTATLKVGDTAPEFPNPLPSSAGEKPGDVKLSLQDALGKKNIVLAFYVADWTGG